jgi:hypothetical protein
VWTSVEGPPEQFACPPGLAQPDTDFCLDLQGLELGRQYSAEVLYQLLDALKQQWSPRGSPLFFILVQDESTEQQQQPRDDLGPQTALKFEQLRVQMDGPRSMVHWQVDGQALDQVRAYQVKIYIYLWGGEGKRAILLMI